MLKLVKSKIEGSDKFDYTGVYLMVRGESPAATRADYLIRRSQASGKITLNAYTEITALAGNRFLEQVTWKNRQTGEPAVKKTSTIFTT